MTTRVLVAYATHHGTTREIAERIAVSLNKGGLRASAQEVTDTGDLDGYDAFVVGSAIYAFRWLKEANDFVIRNRQVLSTHPVWLFSSGPLGTSTVDARGQDVRQWPREVGVLSDLVNGRDHRIFFGAYDPTAKPIGLIERITRASPEAREQLTPGDFRDWDEIDAWASSIVEQLAGT
jgi:menaquinone-dependent protoporphyrinogen oxidase